MGQDVITMRYADEQVAQVVHEATRALQYVQGDQSPAEPWFTLSDEAQESAVAGVRRIRSGVSLAEHHQAWVTYMKRLGWRWGPEKDRVRKTHPDLLDWSMMTERQRDKARLFQMVVTAMTVTT
jgi:hypothetical protein